MNELTVGRGCVAVATTRKEDGTVGIVFEQMEEPMDIGEVPLCARCYPTKGAYFVPTEKDFILWIENLESAAVIKRVVDIVYLFHKNGKNTDKQGQ